MYADHYVRSISTLGNRNILALSSVVDATSGPQNIEQPTAREGDGVAVDHSTALVTGIVGQPVVRPGVDVAVRRQTASAPGRVQCDDLNDGVGTTPSKPYRCQGSGRFANIPSTSGRTSNVEIEKTRLAAADAVRQLRVFARNASAKVPGVLHHYTSVGTIRPLDLPQSACSGLLRRRCIPTVDVATTDDDSTDEIEVVPAGKRKRTTNTKSDRRTKPKSDQPRVRKPRAYKPRAYKPRVPNPNFTYPDADEKIGRAHV